MAAVAFIFKAMPRGDVTRLRDMTGIFAIVFLRGLTAVLKPTFYLATACCSLLGGTCPPNYSNEDFLDSELVAFN